MFNIVPSWIYGSEIWPQEVRAKAYSMTILGWAIGCGITGFVIPIMLSRLGYGTFLFFGAMNALSAPITFLFYPELANRSLEEVNLLFTTNINQAAMVSCLFFHIVRPRDVKWGHKLPPAYVFLHYFSTWIYNGTLDRNASP